MERTLERHELRSPGTARGVGRLILTIPAGDARQYLILSPQLVGVPVHWDPACCRTVPCTGEECRVDHFGTHLTEQWWGAVVGRTGGRVLMLAFTESAVKEFPALTEKGRNLVGMPVEIGRPKGGKRGKMVVTPFTCSVNAAKLPAAPDVREFLYRLYGKWFSPET